MRVGKAGNIEKTNGNKTVLEHIYIINTELSKAILPRLSWVQGLNHDTRHKNLFS